MSTVSNVNLAPISCTNVQCTIQISYDVEFTEFERNLAGMGMTFHAHIDTVGVDPNQPDQPLAAASFLDPPISAPGPVELPVTAGSGPQTLHRTLSQPVTRASLQEDPGPDSDEIRCNIRIHSVGLPPAFTPNVPSQQRTVLG